MALKRLAYALCGVFLATIGLAILAFCGHWIFGLRAQSRRNTTTSVASVVPPESNPVRDAGTAGYLESGSTSLHPLITAFRHSWKPGPDFFPIRAEGWKARMKALVGFAKLRTSAIPPLLEALEDREPSVRALAAEALGYVGDSLAAEPLALHAANDPDWEVRLYAAKSRKMLEEGTGGLAAETSLSGPDDPLADEGVPGPRDPTGKAMSLSAADRLGSFDPQLIDSARIHEVAPDFELDDLHGRPHRLSGFQGKKIVALVFLHGATCEACIGQAASFRQISRELDAIKAEVLVVESHPVDRIRETLDTRSRRRRRGAEPVIPDDVPAVTYLADPDSIVAATYGVAFQWSHGDEWSNRPATFLIDDAGIVQAIHRAESYMDRLVGSALLAELAQIRSMSKSRHRDQPAKTRTGPIQGHCDGSILLRALPGKYWTGREELRASPPASPPRGQSTRLGGSFAAATSSAPRPSGRRARERRAGGPGRGGWTLLLGRFGQSAPGSPRTAWA
jgi:peroxiredoxin